MTVSGYEAEVPGAVVEPSPGPLSRREEARRDRLLTAPSEAGGGGGGARARRARGAVAPGVRAERRAALARWVREHTTDLLFVPVIGVPGALAWTAMAAYGAGVYRPARLALPAFPGARVWAV